MADNWIERKARIERALKDGTPTLWLEVVAAIGDCCDSFERHYPEPLSAKADKSNGHRVQVTISRIITHNRVRQAMTEHIIEIALEESKAEILVFMDRVVTKFQIGSDESHAFLVQDNKPLEIDDFTKKILEPVLFPATQSAPSSGWSRQSGR